MRRGKDKDEEEKRSVAHYLGYCPGIRLVLIGETTENYRSEQPAARILLQTAAEFDPAIQPESKIRHVGIRT